MCHSVTPWPVSPAPVALLGLVRGDTAPSQHTRDRSICQIRELVPESQAYMDLLAFERKLDQTIARKRMEIQEAIKKPLTVRGGPGLLGELGGYEVGAAVGAASHPLTPSIPPSVFLLHSKSGSSGFTSPTLSPRPKKKGRAVNAWPPGSYAWRANCWRT